MRYILLLLSSDLDFVSLGHYGWGHIYTRLPPSLLLNGLNKLFILIQVYLQIVMLQAGDDYLRI
jgi:hypothetical protein